MQTHILIGRINWIDEIMDYKIADIEKSFDGKIIKNLGNNDYVIKINDNEHELKIINMNSTGIEFILDKKYHKAKYLDQSTNEMNIVIDNVPIIINRHTHFDEVVFKHSGGAGAGNVQLLLKSQIPGKVVSISVAEGDSVKKGDVICTLESMKMQVSVKAHKDGVVKSIKIKETVTVAKGDPIAEIE
ncbi:MAG: acetyl-CoA carboxylase biotin carboxyl carrier protein subunit [Nitrosopumilus sp.]|nr:acetyl-CoA carboxylase biotin carboxyl carrier protein subunit [Nitrosopumilus sp.]MDH3490305.1 acetyl-CoA carboxylase biotin carboxyl carrier protein subunit [Nitrosopumilus sp.]MDH3517047.1 acetyl-CoA carboxylase biotin carboxyl carrier protein subunit [Nitrosopumilus sp.]MDH3564173.1 acetyl-CoA carboxylase biotin carboxyl carrier protein subunit [Nitrosopumilus sp.]MDH5418561.1 acetyl-CoA carboxylase biotin carboxyl carrier protein subunit [Nitrosopumilus sp.]